MNQDTGIILPTQEVRITRHWVPDVTVIEAAVLDLIYHTNTSSMTIGGKTWAPGCVLFAGFDSDEQIGGFGSSISKRVDYSFLVDAAGWDKVMSDITGRFDCDTVFPAFRDQYQLEASDPPRTDGGITYTIQRWRRRDI